MSPAKFVGDNYAQATTREINGPRPTPLRVNGGSRIIQKPSSLYSDRQQRQHPVIIYAHSPKVIHTKPRDFMALVQKLTGLSRSDDDKFDDINETPPNHQSGLSTMRSEEVRNHEREPAAKLEDNESSSGLTDEENSGNGGGGSINVSGSSSFLSPTVPNRFLADIPLFTPNSTNFFFSPSPIPLYRYADHSLFPSPNMGNTISPSIFEAKKELPQH